MTRFGQVSEGKSGVSLGTKSCIPYHLCKALKANTHEIVKAAEGLCLPPAGSPVAQRVASLQETELHSPSPHRALSTLAGPEMMMSLHVFEELCRGLEVMP